VFRNYFFEYYRLFGEERISVFNDPADIKTVRIYRSFIIFDMFPSKEIFSVQQNPKVFL
jgi:hypothetical protein